MEIFIQAKQKFITWEHLLRKLQDSGKTLMLGKIEVREACLYAVLGIAKSRTRLSY